MVPSTSKSTISINEIRHYTGGTGICPRRPVENCLTHKHMKTEDDKIKGIRICREAMLNFELALCRAKEGSPEGITHETKEWLADCHDQFSRGLHWLVSEDDAAYIMGGRASEISEFQDGWREPVNVMEHEWDND